MRERKPYHEYLRSTFFYKKGSFKTGGSVTVKRWGGGPTYFLFPCQCLFALRVTCHHHTQNIRIFLLRRLAYESPVLTNHWRSKEQSVSASLSAKVYTSQSVAIFPPLNSVPLVGTPTCFREAELCGLLIQKETAKLYNKSSTTHRGVPPWTM